MSIQGCRKNREITGVLNVRLIDEEGQQVGVVSLCEALYTADVAGLDLIEVSPKAEPPVCKIGDYNRMVYQENKSAREHKPAPSASLKEVQFRPAIGENDIQVKLRNATRFLQDGDKVKLVILFRGREMTHREIGYELLNRLIAELSSVGTIDQAPAQEGKKLFAVLKKSSGK